MAERRCDWLGESPTAWRGGRFSPCHARRDSPCSGAVLSDEVAVLYALARAAPAAALTGATPEQSAEVDEWLHHAAASPTVVAASLEAALACRTYLVGYGFTLADIVVFLAVQGA